MENFVYGFGLILTFFFMGFGIQAVASVFRSSGISE